MTYIYIFIGGGIGSLFRFLLGKWVNPESADFPMGTFIANILACLVLALTLYTFSPYTLKYSWVTPLLVVGFCGGFSTFSTFSNETVHLIENGNMLLAVINVLVSITVGIALIYWVRTNT